MRPTKLVACTCFSFGLVLAVGDANASLTIPTWHTPWPNDPALILFGAAGPALPLNRVIARNLRTGACHVELLPDNTDYIVGGSRDDVMYGLGPTSEPEWLCNSWVYPTSRAFSAFAEGGNDTVWANRAFGGGGGDVLVGLTEANGEEENDIVLVVNNLGQRGVITGGGGFDLMCGLVTAASYMNGNAGKNHAFIAVVSGSTILNVTLDLTQNECVTMLWSTAANLREVIRRAQR